MDAKLTGNLTIAQLSAELKKVDKLEEDVKTMTNCMVELSKQIESEPDPARKNKLYQLCKECYDETCQKKKTAIVLLMSIQQQAIDLIQRENEMKSTQPVISYSKDELMKLNKNCKSDFAFSEEVHKEYPEIIRKQVCFSYLLLLKKTTAISKNYSIICFCITETES